MQSSLVRVLLALLAVLLLGSYKPAHAISAGFVVAITATRGHVPAKKPTTDYSCVCTSEDNGETLKCACAKKREKQEEPPTVKNNIVPIPEPPRKPAAPYYSPQTTKGQAITKEEFDEWQRTRTDRTQPKTAADALDKESQSSLKSKLGSVNLSR